MNNSSIEKMLTELTQIKETLSEIEEINLGDKISSCVGPINDVFDTLVETREPSPLSP